jgi:hypothetical protein
VAGAQNTIACVGCSPTNASDTDASSAPIYFSRYRPIAMARSGWWGRAPSRRWRDFADTLRLGVATLGVVQPGQVVERSADIGVIEAERLLIDRAAALVEGLGLGVATLGVVQPGQVVERPTDIGVIEAERLLIDRAAALVEGLGLGIAALDPVQSGKVVERSSDIGVIGAGRFLAMAHASAKKKLAWLRSRLIRMA